MFAAHNKLKRKLGVRMNLKVVFFVVLALKVNLFLVLANDLNIPGGFICEEEDDYFRVNLSDYPHCPLVKEESIRSYCMTSNFHEQAQKYLEFRVRPDDVWMTGFLKSGTTWRDHLVWQICNDLYVDINTTFDFKVLFFELSSLFSNIDIYLEYLDKMPSPRFFKTHLPVHLLPKKIWTVKPKIVHMTRNVKDVAVSGFHFLRGFGLNVTFSEACELFLHDRIPYTPYIMHITDFWGLRNEDNVLSITFESMKKDTPSIIEKTAEFFGKSLNEEQISNLAQTLSFSNMKKGNGIKMNKTFFVTEDNQFYRKGKVGTYREEMSPEMIEKFDEWIHQRICHHKDYDELLEIFMGI